MVDKTTDRYKKYKAYIKTHTERDLLEAEERVFNDLTNPEYITPIYEHKPTGDILVTERVGVVFKSFSDYKNSKNGTKVESAVSVGMIIEYTTDWNWDKKGKQVTITDVDLENNTVWTDGVFVISMSGFLKNIESGRYKVISG